MKGAGQTDIRTAQNALVYDDCEGSPQVIVNDELLCIHHFVEVLARVWHDGIRLTEGV